MTKTETLIAVLLLFLILVLVTRAFVPQASDLDWRPINSCLQNIKTGALECYEPAPWWHFWERTIMVTPTPHP